MQTSKHPILRHIPRFLQPFTTRFVNAPVTHITSFLILHEITAIVPLIGLWWVFHNHSSYIPNFDFTAMGIDKVTKIIDLSMERFDFSDYSLNEKANFIMEGAYAYIVVKTLAPIRIFISLGLMPAFSRFVVVPFNSVVASIFRKKPKAVETISKDKVKTVTKPRL